MEAAPTKFVYAILMLSTLSSSIIPGHNYQEFSRNLSKKEFGFGREKLSHLHFYFHDIVSVRNPTAVRVALAATTKSSSTLFGVVYMMDYPLTVGANMTSKLVGRAQGIYASADSIEVGLLMAFNSFFTEGKYNGSTPSMLAGNPAFYTGIREMPIVGGSGLFRFARGFVEAKIYNL